VVFEPPFRVSDPSLAFQLPPRPVDGLTASEALIRLGIVGVRDSGLLDVSTVGSRLIRDIEVIVRTACQRYGFAELQLPLLQSSRHLESSGRLDRFREGMFWLQRPEGWALSATSEEAFIELMNRSAVPNSRLPLRIFQIATKFRRVRPSRSVLRLRQFRMCEMLSIAATQAQAVEEAGRFESLAETVFNSLELPVGIIRSRDGTYTEFAVASEEGDISLRQTRDGSWVHVEKHEAAIKAATVGMYMLSGRSAMWGTVRTSTPSGLIRTSHLGSYGFGVERLLWACTQAFLQSTLAERRWPLAVRPFDAGIILHYSAGDEGRRLLEQIGNELADQGVRMMLDDRLDGSLKPRARGMNDWGVPLVGVLGARELARGHISVNGGHSVPNTSFVREAIATARRRDSTTS
jgi:prolyl-tRNA synthetase